MRAPLPEDLSARLRALGGRMLVAGGALLFAPVGALAATLPQGFQESSAVSGLTSPTAVRFASDGRVFVAEKSGVIKVFDGLSDTTPSVFADISTNVHNYWDRGLLGLALHPKFPATPYVYVLYTYDATIGGTSPRWGTVGMPSDGCPSPLADTCPVSGRLSRLQAAGNVMTGSEQVLIEDWCQQYPSHSVGDLAFGADGALYVTSGEGASFTFTDYGQGGNPPNPCRDPAQEGGALRSQDIRTSGDATSLDGAVLRVDPDTGSALPDNPLAFSSDPNTRRIVAHGLRNPFRIAARPGTEELWVGDVGWNAWEEIDRIADAGDGSVENFGWPCYEGTSRQSGYESAGFPLCESLYSAPNAVAQPYFAYPHTGSDCASGGSSVAGLAFYSGGTYPSSYAGALFFADYSRRCIWAMLPGSDGTPDPARRLTFLDGASSPVDLEVGPGGDLFYVDFDGGSVRRIQYFRSNQPPVARATATPTSGTAPLTVDFDGTTSSDADPGDSLTYAWDLDGDGAYDDATAARTTYTYARAGRFTARLRATDQFGATGISSPLVITAGNTPPTPMIGAPAAGATWTANETLEFAGSAADRQEGPLPASALTWSLILHHCDASGCHAHPLQDYRGVAGGSFRPPDHEVPSYLELRLTATDSEGLQATTSVRLDPRTVALTFETSTGGLELVVGGTARRTPFTMTAIVNARLSVAAPTPQVDRASGRDHAFYDWSDGGARSHDITVPAVPATYRATFAPPPENLATSPPRVSGSAEVEGVLTAETGAWEGRGPIVYAIRWQRCDERGADCADIPGAVTSTYVVKSSDVARTLRLGVVATNPTGATTAFSTPTGVIRAELSPVSAALPASVPSAGPTAGPVPATEPTSPGVRPAPAPARTRLRRVDSSRPLVLRRVGNVAVVSARVAVDAGSTLIVQVQNRRSRTAVVLGAGSRVGSRVTSRPSHSIRLRIERGGRIPIALRLPLARLRSSPSLLLVVRASSAAGETQTLEIRLRRFP